MSGSKNKWLIGAAGAACVACCAIPIAALIGAGAGSAAIIAFFASDQFKEILICGIPLLLIITGFIYFSKRRKAACCPAPNSGCGPTQCGTDSNKSL